MRIAPLILHGKSLEGFIIIITILFIAGQGGKRTRFNFNFACLLSGIEKISRLYDDRTIIPYQRLKSIVCGIVYVIVCERESREQFCCCVSV